jgi:hypothetical protein
MELQAFLSQHYQLALNTSGISIGQNQYFDAFTFNNAVGLRGIHALIWIHHVDFLTYKANSDNLLYNIASLINL